MFTVTKIFYYFVLVFSGSFLMAGTFEGGGGPSARSFYKTVNQKNEISTRSLNLILANGLYKAKVKRQPSIQLRLFDACINGKHLESISKAPKSHCIDWTEETQVEEGETQKKLTCRRWSKTMSLKNGRKFAKRNPKFCKLVLGSEHPNTGFFGSMPNEMVPLCDYKVPLKKVGSIQTVEVLQMSEFTTNSIYYTGSDMDKVQPGFFRYNYTIPYCASK